MRANTVESDTKRRIVGLCKIVVFECEFFEIVRLVDRTFVVPCRTAAWAQPPDLGLPSGGGDNAGFPFGGGEGVLGEGDRVPKFEAGFTAPGPDRTAQLFIVGNLAAGIPYLFHHAAAGRAAGHEDQGQSASKAC